jgi:eukaryotic-like serine/threonine-protein kinase
MAEQQRADEQAAIARAVNEFLQQDLLGLIDHGSQVDADMDPDPDVKLRTLLVRAAAGVAKRFHGQPQVLDAVRMTVALAYNGIGSYSDAIPLLEQVRAYRAKVLGPEHMDTLHSMYEISNAYARADQPDHAISLAEEVLRVATSLNPDHSDTLISLCRLAELYRDQARYAEAESLLVRGLETSRRKQGSTWEDTFFLEHHLGMLYTAQGRYRESEPLLTQQLEMQRRVLGPDHPDLATTMNVLAATYQAKGDYAKAISLFEEVLSLSRRALGPEHPATLVTTNNLASAYLENGEGDRALALYEHLLPRLKIARGPEHPDTLAALHNLAFTYAELGQLDRALPLIEQTIETPSTINTLPAPAPRATSRETSRRRTGSARRRTPAADGWRG